MKDKNKFAYGEVYEIAPSMGIDCPRGKVQIVGICHPNFLPSYIDLRSWETGDAEFDWDLITEPWYFFTLLESDDDEDLDTVLDLPQFAMDEVFHQARKNRIEFIRESLK